MLMQEQTIIFLLQEPTNKATQAYQLELLSMRHRYNQMHTKSVAKKVKILRTKPVVLQMVLSVAKMNQRFMRTKQKQKRNTHRSGVCMLCSKRVSLC